MKNKRFQSEKKITSQTAKLNREKFELFLKFQLDNHENELIRNYVREYRFHPSRKWRFDFAWPELSIACEIEGGAWVMGRHNRPEGFLNDMEKYDQAIRLGWNVYRTSPAMVKSGHAISTIEILFSLKLKKYL